MAYPKSQFILELEKVGVTSPQEYIKKFSRPGISTIERYFLGDQDPITNTGNWRTVPQLVAEQLNLTVESLFPEAAERRQQILDDTSQDTTTGSKLETFFCVKCPKTLEDNKTPLMVLVSLTCAGCDYRQKLTATELICNHPKVGEV